MGEEKCVRVSRANARSRWIKRGRNKKNERAEARGSERGEAEKRHRSSSFSNGTGACLYFGGRRRRMFCPVSWRNRDIPSHGPLFSLSLPLSRDAVLLLLVPSDPSLARAAARDIFATRRSGTRRASRPRRFLLAKLHNATPNPTPESDRRETDIDFRKRQF